MKTKMPSSSSETTQDEVMNCLEPNVPGHRSDCSFNTSAQFQIKVQFCMYAASGWVRSWPHINTLNSSIDLHMLQSFVPNNYFSKVIRFVPNHMSYLTCPKPMLGLNIPAATSPAIIIIRSCPNSRQATRATSCLQGGGAGRVVYRGRRGGLGRGHVAQADIQQRFSILI